MIGRAEYVGAESMYQLHYVGADGRAAEAWWREGALRPMAIEPEGRASGKRRGRKA